MNLPEHFTFRVARPDDTPALSQMINLSARQLSRDDYTPAEIEAAVAYVFGVDSELVKDGTYYVIEAKEPDDSGNRYAACGGWSRRKTLFGGDQYEGRESGLLDPATDAAKIRAFFVHPDWARRGLGKALLDYCEDKARSEGFKTIEMMATLPGIKLYEACGYHGEDIVVYPMPDGTPLRFMPMSKALFG